MNWTDEATRVRLGLTRRTLPVTRGVVPTGHDGVSAVCVTAAECRRAHEALSAGGYEVLGVASGEGDPAVILVRSADVAALDAIARGGPG